MASGEMSDAEFLAFNEAWMAAVFVHTIKATYWTGTPGVGEYVSTIARCAMFVCEMVVEHDFPAPGTTE